MILKSRLCRRAAPVLAPLAIWLGALAPAAHAGVSIPLNVLPARGAVSANDQIPCLPNASVSLQYCYASDLLGYIENNLAGAGPGSYPNTAYNSFASLLLNGLNPATEFSEQQGGNYASDAFTAGVLVPSFATAHNVDAISAYVVSQRAQPGYGGDVAIYSQSRSAANNSAVWGLNPVLADTAGFTGQKLFNELDFNVNQAGTLVSGLNMFIAGSVTPAGAIATACLHVGTIQWSDCYYTNDGAVLVGASLGATGTGNGVGSQPIQFRGRNSAGVALTGAASMDSNGALDLIAGITGAYVAMIDPVTGNLFICNIGQCQIYASTDATSVTSGSLVTPGGVGIGKSLWVGGTLNFGATTGGLSPKIAILQPSNNTDMIFANRATDASPTGNFLRLVNAAGTANLFNVDVQGNAGVNTLLSQAELYPGTGAGAQTAGGLLAGTGNPASGVGKNGDFYFRTDCTHGSSDCTWHKEAGAWQDLN